MPVYQSESKISQNVKPCGLTPGYEVQRNISGTDDFTLLDHDFSCKAYILLDLSSYLGH